MTDNHLDKFNITKHKTLNKDFSQKKLFSDCHRKHFLTCFSKCFSILSILILSLYLPVTIQAKDFKTELHGVIINKATKQPVGQAVLELPKLGLWAVANGDGEFILKNVPKGKTTLAVSCIGFVTLIQEIDIKENSASLTLYMTEENLKVESVVILAKQKEQEISTSRVIGDAALKHLQMVNVSDVTSLLPGGKTVNPNLMNDNSFSLRDGGYDAGNAAFGTAVEVDGVRLSTNGAMNGAMGVSTRNIASTNIESIEVITGVPSAEYGDIASGIVKLHTRKGRTPYMATFMTNPRTKQVSVSKGFDLGKNSGVLNSSVEYTKATNDPVSPYTAYSRTGITLNYNNTFAENLHFNIGLSGTIGGMDSEDDPDAENGEWQRAHDNMFRLNTDLKWQLNKKWITNIDFKASVNYTDKKLRQCLHPTQGTSTPAVHALKEGYFIADVLPANYFTYYNSDSKQLDYAAEIKATWVRSWDRIRSNAKIGFAWRANGNVGEGEYYDNPKLAPNGYRPYPYSNIPYLHNLALYIEELLTLPVGQKGSIQLMAGIRMENTIVSGSKYKNTQSYSPRFNLKYKVNKWLTLRGGWGLAEKLPSLGVLYPRPNYRDLSAFEQRQGEGGTYFYYTSPYQMTYNPNLKWQRNRNAEVGVDLKFGDFSLSMVGYFNRTTNPYTMKTFHDSFDYRYSELPSSITSPENVDFKIDQQTGDVFMRDLSIGNGDWTKLSSTDVRTFARNTMQANGSPIDRKGFEFVMNFPEISPIRTQIRLDGAYNHVKYINRGEAQYFPANYTGKKAYPFVGIYPDNGGNTSVTYNGMQSTRLDMNLTAVTRIPSIRLIVSVRLEASFLRQKQNISDYKGKEYAFNIDKDSTTPKGGSIYDGNSYTGMWPIAYLYYDEHEVDPTKRIKRHSFGPEEMRDPKFKDLFLQSTNIYQYRETDYTPYFSANLSITKEIGDHVSVSFYANNFTNAHKYVKPYPEGVGAVFTPDFYYGLTVRVKF